MPQRAHRFEHGSLTCFALHGASDHPSLPVINLLLPPDGDEAKRPAAEKTAVIRGMHSCLLVEFDGRRVLIDGSLDSKIVRSELRETGVAEAEVDLILVTHGDTDHIAGLVDEDLRLIYSNARIVLHRDLWEAWVSGGQRGDPNPFYEDRQRKIAQALAEQIADRVTLVDGDGSVSPGIHALAAPGHRPSHLAYEIADGDHRLLHIGDAAIAPILVEQSGRGNAFDSDPQLGIRSRQALLERATQPGTLTYIPHFPWPGLVMIERRVGRFAWSPAA